jgi:hypothetical protein
MPESFLNCRPRYYLVTVFGGSLSRGRRTVYSYSPTFITAGSSAFIAKEVDMVTTSVGIKCFRSALETVAILT